MTAGELTKRQREALVLRANGNTNGQIAHWLGIKESAVEGLLARACHRLGASNTIHAVAIALALDEIGAHQIIVLVDDTHKEAA